MQLKFAALLAGLAMSQAEIVRRQCYPETVYITSVVDPVTSTTTCTETSVSTETITSRLQYTVTTTKTFTSSMTVQGSTVTVTETLEGPVSLSFTLAPSIAHPTAKTAAAAILSAGTCTSSGSCDSLSSSSFLTGEYDAATSTRTLHGTTFFVVPLATLPPKYPPTDVVSTTVISALPSTSHNVIVTSPTLLSTQFETVTVSEVETVQRTSFVTIPSLIPPFPTLNVTGTQGVNPSSVTGFASGIVGSFTGVTAVTVTTGNQTSAEPFASQIMHNSSSSAASASFATADLNGTSAVSAATSEISLSQTIDVSSTNVILKSTNATQSSTSRLAQTITPILAPPGSAQNWTFTRAVTQTVTSASRNATVNSMTSSVVGAVLSTHSRNSTAAEVVATAASSPLAAQNSTALQSSQSSAMAPSSSGSQPVTVTSPIPTTTATSNPFRQTPNLTSIQVASAPSTLRTPGNTGSNTLNASASRILTPSGSGPFANSTSTFMGSSSTASGATAGISPRCANEDPFAWRKLERHDSSAESAILENGETIMIYWDSVLTKRQVGEIVTATIEGHVVTWANNWNGVESVDPDSAASARQAASSMDSRVVTLAPPSIPTLLSAPKTISIEPSISNNLALSNGQTVRLESAEVIGTSVELQTSTSIVLSTSLASSRATTLEIGVSAATGSLPSYTPPGWLTSMFPLKPTAVSSTAATVLGAQDDTRTSQTMPSSLNSASINSASIPTATCGGPNSGPFTINFDDLPRSGQPSTTNQYPPLTNPYHKLFWSAGYSYVPPPSDPYPPHSGNQLGIFNVDGNANIHSLNWTGPIPAGDEVNGMLGAGVNFQNPSYYFDAIGAWVGCQNSGPDECDIQVNGFGYDDITGQSVLQVDQHFYQSPCAELTNCSLEYLAFSKAFHNLTALQIIATHQSDPNKTALTWYIDDLALVWTNNGCEAVKARNVFT